MIQGHFYPLSILSVFKELEIGGGHTDKKQSSKVIGKINEIIYCYCINTQVNFFKQHHFQVYTQYDYNGTIFKGGKC